MPRIFHAFIDEAGDRSASLKSSEHFVLAATVLEDANLGKASALLAQLRADLGRRPTDVLHWQNMKSHSHRLRAAQLLGGETAITIAAVIVCKRLFLQHEKLTDEDAAYLFTLRFLLERLSWFARDRGGQLNYTLAHIRRFKMAKLRTYEAVLPRVPGCSIEWPSLAGPGAIDQPSRVHELQLADIAASATFKAFEPDGFGNTEVRYLDALAPRLYRRPPGALGSYGLKVHPMRSATHQRHPWLASALQRWSKGR